MRANEFTQRARKLHTVYKCAPRLITLKIRERVEVSVESCDWHGGVGTASRGATEVPQSHNLGAFRGIDAEMDVRPGGVAGHTREADDLAGADRLARRNIYLREVGIERVQAVAVLDHHPLAEGITAPHKIRISCPEDGTRECGLHGSADRRCNVYGVMAVAVIYLRIGGREWRIAEILGDAESVAEVARAP